MLGKPRPIQQNEWGHIRKTVRSGVTNIILALSAKPISTINPQEVSFIQLWGEVFIFSLYLFKIVRIIFSFSKFSPKHIVFFLITPTRCEPGSEAIRCIRMLRFFGTEIWWIAEERDQKVRSKKASVTFGRDLRPKAREQNSALESRP